MPIIQQVIDSLDIESVFRDHVKHDTRDKLPVSRVLASALCNVILERYPLYKMGHWAIQRGLVAEELADCFNDDRIGRALDRLFNADRAAISVLIPAECITIQPQYDCSATTLIMRTM